MNKMLSTVGLGTRLFLVWWLGPSLLFGLLGIAPAFCFFFLVGALLAVYGAHAQYQGMGEAPFARRIGAFHHAVVQVPMATGEAEKEVATLLQEDLAATSFSISGRRIHAVFQPPAWSGWWRRWTLSDEVILEVLPANPDAGDTPGCTLEVSAGPLSRVFNGFLWIDRGRNYHRLRALQEALGKRMAQDSLRKEAARKSDSLEARLAQAELLLLRAQVEPHFLFNTLAHLRQLILSGESPTSLAMVDHLIAYSRSVSDRIRQATHRLEQEMEAARGYLSLIQLRFGERLAFEIQAEAETLDCEVPVGCLLIPIENAIKHGIEPRSAKGFVGVRCHLAEGLLSMEVRDDGPGLSMDQGSGQGTGLANLRERLKLLFSEAGRLAVEDHEEGGVLVRVQIPVWRR